MVFNLLQMIDVRPSTIVNPSVWFADNLCQQNNTFKLFVTSYKWYLWDSQLGNFSSFVSDKNIFAMYNS